MYSQWEEESVWRKMNFYSSYSRHLFVEFVLVYYLGDLFICDDFIVQPVPMDYVLAY